MSACPRCGQAVGDNIDMDPVTESLLRRDAQQRAVEIVQPSEIPYLLFRACSVGDEIFTTELVRYAQYRRWPVCDCTQHTPMRSDQLKQFAPHHDFIACAKASRVRT